MQRTFRGWKDSGAYVKEIWTGSTYNTNTLSDSTHGIDDVDRYLPIVMGFSYDSAPHVGSIPGKPGQYICAGFNGHGMPVVFLAAQGLADMVRTGKSFEEVKLPRIYKTTMERIYAAQNGPAGGDILDD